MRSEPPIPRKFIEMLACDVRIEEIAHRLSSGFFSRSVQVRRHHYLGELFQHGLRRPAKKLAGLRCVADEVARLGRPDVSRIQAHVVVPVEADMAEGIL